MKNKFVKIYGIWWEHQELMVWGHPFFFYLPKWWLCIKGDYPQTGLVQVCVLFKACPDPFKQSLSTHVNSGHKFKWHSFLAGYFAMIHHVWFFWEPGSWEKSNPKPPKNHGSDWSDHVKSPSSKVQFFCEKQLQWSPCLSNGLSMFSPSFCHAGDKPR